MAFRTLQYRFTADGRQFEAATGQMGQAAGRVSQAIGGWAGAASAAVGALTQVVDVLDTAVDRAQQLERSLDLAQGAATPEGRAVRDHLLGLGFTSAVATDTAAAIVGRTRFDAGSDEQLIAAQTAAQFARAGGDANELLRAASTFGVDDAAGITELAQLVFAGSGAQNADLGEITGALRSLAPSTTQLGLGARETLQLALGAERISQDPGSLRTPLTAALGRQAQGGGDALEFLRGVEERIAAAATEEQALAIALPVFGDRGSVAFTRGIRSGEFGFAAERLSDAHLAGELGLGAVEATNEERVEAIIAAGGISGNVLGALSSVPLAGGVARSVANLTAGARGGPDWNVTVELRDSTARGIEAVQDISDGQREGRAGGAIGQATPTR